MTRIQSYLKQVGKNIRKAREKSVLRQIDVEEKTGLTYRHYQSIEAGKINVTISTLFRLARLFKVKVSDLVTLAGGKKAS